MTYKLNYKGIFYHTSTYLITIASLNVLLGYNPISLAYLGLIAYMLLILILDL